MSLYDNKISLIYKKLYILKSLENINKKKLSYLFFNTNQNNIFITSKNIYKLHFTIYKIIINN